MLIPAGNPSAWTGPTGTNTYFLAGHVPALIDAGVGRPEHLETLAAALAGAPLRRVIVTHGHPDHAGGVPAILERWPSADVRNANGDRLSDGERIEAGDTILRAIYTPGHAPDHFCLFDEQTGDLYCGDLARRGGSIVIPASSGGSLTQYLESLAKVRALGPRRLLPGHGPAVDDPAALIDEYIRHREERDRQVIAALDAGARTLDAIVERVYGRMPQALVRGARDSALAHLVKLAAEGRARERDGEWERVG